MTEIKKIVELAENEILALEKLDRAIVKKYGNSFSNEIWTAKNFKYDLPKKLDYSFILFENDELLSYIVASQKNQAIYIHRFAVNKKGYAKPFFDKILESYGDINIYLMVNVVNINAIRFYKDFNFNIVEDEKIIRKFISKNLTIDDHSIIIEENYRCYLLKKEI